MSPRLKVFYALAATLVALPVSNVPAQPSGGVLKPIDETAPLAQPIGLEELEKLIGGRTTLKFDFKDAKPEEVASEIARQTGLEVTPRVVSKYELESPGYQEQRFTLHTQGQQFWRAVLDWSPPPATPENKTPTVSTEVREAYVDSSADVNALTAGVVGMESKGVGRGFELGQSWMPVGRVHDAWPGLLIAYGMARGQKLSLRRTAQEEEKFQDRLRINLRAYIEPRLRLAQVPMRCDILEAVDDKGNDLRLPWRVRGESSSSNGSSHEITAVLLSRPDMGRKLAKPRGVLRFVVISRSQAVELTDLKKPFEQQIYRDGRIGLLRFGGLQPDGTGWKFNLESERNGDDLKRWWAANSGPGAFGNMDELSFLRDFNQSLRMYDHNGQPAYGFGPGTTRMELGKEDGQILDAPISPPPPDIEKWKFKETFNYSVSGTQRVPDTNEMVAVGTPTRIVADLPLERREVSVPFEFNDLPLPPS